MQKIKQLFRSSRSKNGSYSVGMTVLVITIIVILNLLAGQIPEKYRNLDVSSTKIYEISKTSQKLLKNLEHKVQFTVLADQAKMDERIVTFLSKYAGLSSKLSVEWIDPVLHPSALQEYEASENSIVVSCEDTQKKEIVSFQDIIVMDMASYYYTGSASEVSFDGEGQLSSAVHAVTSEEVNKIYQTSGHGEMTLSSTIQELLEKGNYTVEGVNTVMKPEIPKDCELLLINAPSSDLTEDEKTAIEEYLKNGGDAMLLLGDTNSTELPNLASLMKIYGMEGAEGYVADTKRSYQNNYYCFFPELSVSGDLAENLESHMTLLLNAHGMQLTKPERESISVREFMTTSDAGYAVTQESQSEAGQYVLGAVAEEGESRFTVISAGSLIAQQITDTFPQLENTTLFLNAVAANFEGMENLSIEAKSLTPVYNTMQHADWLSILVIFILPLGILAIGFGTWMKRRKA